MMLVSSNSQADELAGEHEDFRLYHINAAQMLDAGTMASCRYIGKEVANICWIATTGFGNSYTIP